MGNLYNEYMGTRFEGGTPSAMTLHVGSVPRKQMHETVFAHQAGMFQDREQYRGSRAPQVPHSLGQGNRASPAAQMAYGDTTTPGYAWMQGLQAPRMFGKCGK